MRILGWCVFFVGGCLVLSSLIISKTINLKDEHVISLTNGSIKLGEVYREMNVVSVKFSFDDAEMKETYMLSNDDPVNSYKDAIRAKLQPWADAINRESKKKEKLTVEQLGLKKSAILEISSSIVYQSEHHPSFTLRLKEKTIAVPVDSIVYSFITDQVDSLLKEQQPDYDAASFINK